MRVRAISSSSRVEWLPLFVHLRLHYQLLFLSPLFAFGFMLGGGVFSGRALLGFVAFHVFLYGGITAYNSYYDRDEGPVGGLLTPPPVSEALFGFSLAVQGAGLALSAWVGFEFALLYAAVMALSVAYSHPRFRWKARPLLALLVVALGQGAVGFAGGWLCGSTPPKPYLGSAVALLGTAVTALMTAGFYPLTQLYQIDEDRARGDRTFAVVFGAKASFRFALTCVALGGACLVPLVGSLFGIADALLIAAVFAAFLTVIARWQSRFDAGVHSNFRILHVLQSVFSVGILGYIAVRLMFR
jgi:4-hydroxybenzoate polyprenyltransferase